MLFLTLILVFCALTLASYVVLGLVRNVLFERLGRPRSAEDLAMMRLLSLRLLFACLFLSVTVILLMLCEVYNLAILLPIGIAVAIGGAQLPALYYRHRFRQRQALIEEKLLDFTIALVNGLKSGMSFGQSLEAVAKRSSGPIQEEFQQTLREQRLGLDMAEALDRLVERVPCEDLRLLVTSVKLTIRTGGSLSEVLTEMIDTMRQRREFADKLQTLTAQGKFQAIVLALAPVIGFFLLLLVNRPMMLPLITTATGWMAIGVIAILISVGYFCINKITSIEI